MTHTKHTEGPWEVRRFSLEKGRGFGIVSVPDCDESCGKLVHVSCNHEEVSVFDAEKLCSSANARLIAAAPELLAALEIAKATIERIYPSRPGFSSVQGTNDVINQAIAKATGGVK